MDVNLKLFISSTWDKMSRLGKISINQILVKTHNLKSSLNGRITYVLCNTELKFIFVIRFWLTSIPIISTVTRFFSISSEDISRVCHDMALYFEANKIKSK